ncbi:hypothetical protein C0993_008660 [Termitomyces sp. T159_Od127]|nr:hypothetical protein C0993_008660 [Termitomyces sp. T159_Od127]
MALAVSPLMLLLPQEYAELTRKEVLLNLWTQIGGLEHPSAVVAAEKAIWRVIFNVSLGQDVIKELKLALENVKDTMSTMVPQWIAVAGMPEPAKDFTIDSKKRTRRGRPIDSCWSLASTSLKALSTPHLPNASETFLFPPFSSDKVAWKEVQGRAYCRSWESYPISDMRWELAATGSTHRYWHINCNGLGTFLRVEAGVKLWFIATPLKGNFDEFSSIDLFTPGFDLDKTNEELWNVEAVLLKAGSFL